MINIVAADCKPSDEKKFNEWYDNVHIALLMKHPALKAVTRYRFRGGSEGQAKYLAVYEFESPEAFEAFGKSAEFAAARDEMRQTWGDPGIEIKWRSQYDTLKSWKK
jgi:uncharacterized protein (TIGR02118 family)